MSVLVSLLPGLLLFATLAIGCYPGERVLARARRRLRAVMRRRAPRSVRLPPERRGSPGLPRGGRLVAAAVASRPPPVVA